MAGPKPGTREINGEHKVTAVVPEEVGRNSQRLSAIGEGGKGWVAVFIQEKEGKTLDGKGSSDKRTRFETFRTKKIT